MSAEAGGAAEAAVSALPTPGEWLRQERERHSLTVQQAAEDLRLDPWIIEAIEANNFAALGAPVYAKGHLRKYALLLRLAPEAVIERYRALHDTPEVPTPIPATLAAPMPRERKSLRVPLWIFGILAAAGAAWLLAEIWVEPREDVQIEMPVVAPAEVPASGAAEEPAASSSQEPLTPPAASQDVAASQEPPAVTPAPAVAVQPAPSAVNEVEIPLALEFREPAWAEVHDANGVRLMFDMGTPGRPRVVRGVPPFRVTLGRAAAVSVNIEGRPVAIPQRPGRDLARFVVAADGSTEPGA